MKSTTIFRVLVLGWMILLFLPPLVSAKQNERQIVILHTNNLHGEVLPCPT